VTQSLMLFKGVHVQHMTSVTINTYIVQRVTMTTMTLMTIRGGPSTKFGTSYSY